MNTTFNSTIIDTVNRPRIALVQSCWHQDIVDEFRKAFVEKFGELDGRQVDCFTVPGAFEIPLQAKLLAASGDYAGVVATGLVVDGGIYRHDFVATAVIDGLMRAQLDTGVPVFSGVLTPHDFMSEGREEFFARHFVVKGTEVANACALTLQGYQQAAVA